MGRKSFSYGDVLGFGWNVMKDNFLFFVGIFLVLILISLAGPIISSIAKHFPEAIPPFLMLALLPVMLIIEIVVGIGLIRITFAFCDGNHPKFSTLFNARGCFWRYIGTALLYGLIIMAASAAGVLVPRFLFVTAFIPYSGLLILIAVVIMTVILSIKFSLCLYFVIDKKLGPVNALRASSRATTGVKLSLFVFGILCGLINFVGVLCFIIGLFATLPTVMVAMALVYRQLSAQTPELAELGITRPDAPFAAGIPAAPNTGPDTSVPPGFGIRLKSIYAPQFEAQAAPTVNIQAGTIPRKSRALLPVVILGIFIILVGLVYFLWPATKGAEIVPVKIQVTGILYSDDKSSAIVNGKVVRKGDIINDVNVVEIHKNSVEFESKGKRWTQEAE